MTPDAATIAQALLRCPSVTPHDAGALDTLQHLLQAHRVRDPPHALLRARYRDGRQPLRANRNRCAVPAFRRTHGRGAAPATELRGDTTRSGGRSPTGCCTDAARRT